MNLTDRKKEQLYLGAAGISLLLVSVFFLRFFYGHLFFYQEKSAIFLLSFDFLKEHLPYPGRILEYSGKLVAAFYHSETTGALLMSSIILASVFLARAIIFRLTRRNGLFIAFLVGTGMLLLQSNYQYAAFNNLGILLQLAAVYISVRFDKGTASWLPVVLLPFWYFITGGFALLFVVAFLVFQVTFRPKSWIFRIPLTAATAIVTYYVSAEFLFYQTPGTLLTYPFSIQHTGMQFRESMVMMVVIVLIPLFAKTGLLLPEHKMLRRLNTALPFVMVMMTAAILYQRYDPRDKEYFHVEKLFYQQKYEEINQYLTRHPSTNILTLYLNNLALAETGQLTERLFDFPQAPDGSTLILNWDLTSEVLKRGGYFYYTTGMVNEALRWAYEYMVMRGHTPEGLKMLIKTELINGHHQVAEKYVNLLEQTLFYRKEAQKYRQMLFNDEAVSADPELGAKREIRPRSDFFVLTEAPSANLKMLVSDEDPGKTQVEYYLAWLLLQKDAETISMNLPLLVKAGYTRIPRHIDEAVAIHKQLHQAEIPEFTYIRGNQDTGQRLLQFQQGLEQNRSSRQQAERALYTHFRNTFWYYLFFR
jgi:hypothetical protein